MRRLLSVLGWICISWTVASSQISYLNRSDLLEKAGDCLQHTYSFSFQEARNIQSYLLAETPGHPTPFFLEALIVYWENFPLTPSTEASDQFIGLLDRVIDLADVLMEDSATYNEGLFFDLFGRAFKAMFWADNGKSTKVVPDLRIMYRYTKKGFDLKDQYDEFYFSTGLYNYYIEAYPDAHPVYKPLVAFMHKGDREEGLKQLHYAIQNAVYLKVEALLFMSLIQLKYENDLNSAAIYAERLVDEYPGNIMYQGHLISILLHQHRFNQARNLLDTTKQQQDPYSKMVRTYASGFIAEKVSEDVSLARTAYQETIGMADAFGPLADIYKAMGYMGLSRLSEKVGLEKESRSYARKASRLSSYTFIFED